RVRSMGFVGLPAFFGLSLLQACVPPEPAPETPPSEPEEPHDSGIPWAPGESPSDASSTTREVTPEPQEQESKYAYYKDDGISQTGSGPACTGKAPPALRASVDARTFEVKSCGDKIPVSRGGARGDIKVNLKVGTDGGVLSVDVLSDSLSVPEVTACVAETLKKPFSDAPPRGGCAVFVIPIHFDSEKVEPAPVEGDAGVAPAEGDSGE